MLQSVSAVDVAMTGIRAQRVRMNLIAKNIANVETTRTPTGGRYRHQVAVFRDEQLSRAIQPDKFGARVQRIEGDDSPLADVYDPSHRDANSEGVAQFPNVNLEIEMINLVSAQRTYEEVFWMQV